MKKRKLMDMLDPRAWGASLIKLHSATPPEHFLEVYRHSPDGGLLVGRLSYEDGEYVFCYDEDYNSEPISAFPSIEREYRSHYLWPFFTARIPPLDREDVRREMSNLSIKEDQVIDILGSVASVSVTSPYQFKVSA